MIRGCRSTRNEKNIIKSKVGKSKDTQNLDLWSDKKEQSIRRHLEQNHGSKFESFHASSSNEHLSFYFVLRLCLALFGSIPPYAMLPGLWIIGHLNSWLLTLPLFMALPTFTYYPMIILWGWPSATMYVKGVDDICIKNIIHSQSFSPLNSLSQHQSVVFMFLEIFYSPEKQNTKTNKTCSTNSGEANHEIWLKWHSLVKEVLWWLSRRV